MPLFKIKANFMGELGLENFQDTFETRKRSFIRAFSICMTVCKKNDLTYNSLC